MRLRLTACLLAACLVSADAVAAEPAAKPGVQPGAQPAVAAAADTVPKWPADKTIRQSARSDNGPISYDVTISSLPVKAGDKVTAQVVLTTYTVPGRGAARPVTFVLNGGPGGASVYLNFGAVGPKRIQFGDNGDAPSTSGRLEDNPNSWLDFTDLVFIDPVGTGYSRSLIGPEETKKAFYNSDADIKYLSRIIYDWMSKTGRLRSPAYILGESYGGYRAPRIGYELQFRLGVPIHGIVMVSPFLDGVIASDLSSTSPFQAAIDLPSMAAAKLEREGRLSADTIADVERYSRGPFIVDLLAGNADPSARDRLTANVSRMTGLDPAVVARLGGRVDRATFLRELRRGEGKIGSVYDSNVLGWDAFPAAASPKNTDPVLASIIAPITAAMADFMTREVGWKADDRYIALARDLGSHTEWGTMGDVPVQELRKAMAADPEMRVLIAHGYNDLACPYFASRLVVDQMPVFNPANPVKLAVYPGGHMFYSRRASGAAFRADVRALYR